MRIEPHEPGLGVEVTDLDIADATDEQVAEIRRLVYRHKLLVFRDQHMDEERYLSMARRFGRLQVYFQDHYHHPDHPEIFVSSNVPQDGQKVGVAGTGRFWHTDYAFFDEPLSTVFVYPQVIPERGTRETYFIDMEHTWRTMPRPLRDRLVDTHAFHEVTWYYKVQPWDIDRALIDLVREIRRESPGAVHPTVIQHPVTGAESLYVSEGFTTRILELSHDESRETLQELFAFIDQPDHIHTHTWERGDLLFWDNRGLIHRAADTEPDQPSTSYRVGVYDDQPFYVGRDSSAGASESPPRARMSARDLA